MSIPEPPPSRPDPAPPLRGRSRHEIEVDVHASVGIVRPGDKLAVAIAHPLSAPDANRIKQQLETRLPGVEVVIVQADALVVYRP